MTWNEANTWIDSLNTSVYLGYNDWRLPDTLPVNGIDYNYTSSSDGTTDVGYNIRSPNSEMAYMYYVELGNDAYGPLSNTSPFSNLQEAGYWSATQIVVANPNPPGTEYAFHFHFDVGLQGGTE